ncbi:hypothetical protein EU244_026580 [Rhodococcus qingshengii]|uniref:hypothetical protein n=1 Tax=Rhodococcus qingshengii TaxID=334542 RepID=UPI0010A6184A|nr:hypothetical protein [Rhodococcus qingshengii]THJ69151.1 hypothetical protein EU244_22695 [Rhodococcus qingshengii]
MTTEPITATELLAEADSTLTDDDKRALSLAYGHNVAVLSLPDLQTRTEWSVSTLPGASYRGQRYQQHCQIVWQAENELASITANERGEISVYVVPHLDVKTALDLAAALTAVVARIAGGDLVARPLVREQ